MKNVAIICAVAIAVGINLSKADERGPGPMGPCNGVVDTDYRQHVGAFDTVQDIKLYDVDAAERTADEQRKAREFKAAHPELFSTKAIIAYWGSENCAPCIPQKRILKARVASYNIVFYDTGKAKDSKLLQSFGHDTATPQILIIAQGKKTAAFRGYTPWDKIKPKAKAARKTDPEETHIDLGRLHIDVIDGEVDINIDDRRDHINGRQFGDRFKQFREREQRLQVREWFEVISAWVVENWSTIVRVTLLLFML